MDSLSCPKCSATIPAGASSCSSCGTAVAGSKFLCESCHGAYSAGELAAVEGRLLCPVCRAHRERRAGGVAEPGLSRMAAWHMRKEPARLSRMAVASLVSAFLFPPVAPLLGIASLVRIDGSRGALRGKRPAMAGTVIGVFFIAAGLFIGLFVLRNYQRIETAVLEKTRNRAAATVLAIAQAEKTRKDRSGEYAGIDALAKDGLVDQGVLNDPEYKFDVFLGRGNFTVTAVPRGNLRLYFLLDEKGELRYEDGRPAVSPGSPLWRDRLQPAASKPAPVRPG